MAGVTLKRNYKGPNQKLDSPIGLKATIRVRRVAFVIHPISTPNQTPAETN